MSKSKIFLFLTIIILVIFSCKTEIKQAKDNQTMQKAIKKIDLTGNYVSENYNQRNEDYDWISIIVSSARNDQLKISARSRADKKKPTCTFDAIAERFDDNTYRTIIDDKAVLFRFIDNSITIFTKKEEDKDILYFYCSGGATLAGTYTKINKSLDEKQIDKTQFSKVLNLQEVGFNVSSIESLFKFC